MDEIIGKLRNKLNDVETLLEDERKANKKIREENMDFLIKELEYIEIIRKLNDQQQQQQQQQQNFKIDNYKICNSNNSLTNSNSNSNQNLSYNNISNSDSNNNIESLQNIIYQKNEEISLLHLKLTRHKELKRQYRLMEAELKEFRQNQEIIRKISLASTSVSSSNTTNSNSGSNILTAANNNKPSAATTTTKRTAISPSKKTPLSNKEIDADKINDTFKMKNLVIDSSTSTTEEDTFVKYNYHNY